MIIGGHISTGAARRRGTSPSTARSNRRRHRRRAYRGRARRQRRRRTRGRRRYRRASGHRADRKRPGHRADRAERGNHADVVQVWGGVKELRIDHLDRIDRLPGPHESGPTSPRSARRSSRTPMCTPSATAAGTGSPGFRRARTRARRPSRSPLTRCTSTRGRAATWASRCGRQTRAPRSTPGAAARSTAACPPCLPTVQS